MTIPPQVAEAAERLHAWIRDYGDQKQSAFIADLQSVLSPIASQQAEAAERGKAIDEKVPGYADTLTLKNVGMLTGKFTMEVTPGDDNFAWDADVVKAFLADQDLHEITIVSTCIGFVKTLTKQFKKEPTK